MSGKVYKTLLAALAAVLFTGVSIAQRELVREREALGLTGYTTELKGAPPVLMLTTVALGGFRGLISNALWIRANDLQDQDKFFEMAQLADWITKLEPHFTQVWLVEAWNMAYNISVKFNDPRDRWRWVERGIELLRDQGLQYNPHDVLIHRELAWFFQHKMGANLDDANVYYKQEWAKEMEEIFLADKPNWDELMNPQTEDARRRVALLKDKYKMDPAFMKQMDETYGPLEWRLPEAHAIYWAAQGLEVAKKNERKIDPNDLITLRRVIYQSMQLSFQRGRLIRARMNNQDRVIDFGPNLEIIPKVSEAYEQAMVEDEKNRDHIETAHRNFLRDAVYFLYTYDRQADAIKWYRYLAKKYPDKPLLDNTPDSLPKDLNLDDYAIARVQDEVDSPGRDKVKGVLEGLEITALIGLAVGEDDRFTGYDRLAQRVLEKYNKKIGVKAINDIRVGLPKLSEIRRDVLARLLDELAPEMVAQLKSRLPPSLFAPPAPSVPDNQTTTPENATTNAPAAELDSK